MLQVLLSIFSHALDQEEEQKLAIRLLCCLFSTHAKKAVSETQGDLLRFIYEKYQVSTVLVQMQNMVYWSLIFTVTVVKSASLEHYTGSTCHLPLPASLW